MCVCVCFFISVGTMSCLKRVKGQVGLCMYCIVVFVPLSYYYMFIVDTTAVHSPFFFSLFITDFSSCVIYIYILLHFYHKGHSWL